MADYNRQNKARVMLRNVVHKKRQFTRNVKSPMKGQSSLAGTQAIDQRWRWLKVYVPHCVKARLGRGVNPAIDTYVYSWQWRSNRLNAGACLWSSLGAAVRARRV